MFPFWILSSFGGEFINNVFINGTAMMRRHLTLLALLPSDYVLFFKFKKQMKKITRLIIRKQKWQTIVFISFINKKPLKTNFAFLTYYGLLSRRKFLLYPFLFVISFSSIWYIREIVYYEVKRIQKILNTKFFDFVSVVAVQTWCMLKCLRKSSAY